MKEVKFFEVRDSMTRISAFAIRLGPDNEIMMWDSPDEQYVWQSGGWGTVGANVFLARVDGSEIHAFAYQWSEMNRTMRTAHEYIDNNWPDLTSGQVIDVRTILGETTEPAIRDRHWTPRSLTPNADAADRELADKMEAMVKGSGGVEVGG